MKKVQPWMFAGMQHWADACDLGTLYAESTLTTRCSANDDLIGGWVNKGVSGGAYVQTDDALRPKLQLNYINGLPAIVGNGNNLHLRKSSTPVIPQPFTVYLVTRVPTVQNNRYWFDGADATTNRVRFMSNGTNNLQLDAGIVVTGPLVDSSAHVYTVIACTATSEVYKDGALEIAASIGTNDIGGLSLLGNRTGAGNLNGGIGEIIIYSGQHTDEQRLLIERYLRVKWRFVR